ncbi:MAG: hypothetical protein EBR92_02930 [Alphaproteobacteria bacterium]|nr:hypothetical protein [Alphaproteobacteria bacterium]
MRLSSEQAGGLARLIRKTALLPTLPGARPALSVAKRRWHFGGGPPSVELVVTAIGRGFYD